MLTGFGYVGVKAVDGRIHPASRLLAHIVVASVGCTFVARAPP